MSRYVSLLSLLAACGLGLVCLPLAHATTVTNEFNYRFQGKDWCEAEFLGITLVRGVPYNDKDSFSITIVSDPLNDGTQTAIQAKLTGIVSQPTISFEAITMRGVAYLTNQRNTQGEFTASGVHPLDASMFFTLRGKVFLDQNGLLTKISGRFVWHWIDQLLGISFDCVGNGTFQTTTKIQ